VMGYADAILQRQPIGPRVAVIGAGGIGFDVAEFLVHDVAHPSPTRDLAAWLREWGVVDPGAARGGVVPPQPVAPARRVTLLQRKAGKLGAGLGKTTGWIHRSALKMKAVEMMAAANYERIGPHEGALGLFVTFGPARRDGTVIACDSIVLCAGQEPLRELHAPLTAANVKVHLIGGACEAGELDAKRAIDQGTRLAAAL
jgi:2,4-dienoyl-CoA reductase (NADPH2)